MSTKKLKLTLEMLVDSFGEPASHDPDLLLQNVGFIRLAPLDLDNLLPDILERNHLCLHLLLVSFALRVRGQMSLVQGFQFFPESL